jgi:hypothetical protein
LLLRDCLWPPCCCLLLVRVSILCPVPAAC